MRKQNYGAALGWAGAGMVLGLVLAGLASIQPGESAPQQPRRVVAPQAREQYFLRTIQTENEAKQPGRRRS